MSGTPVELTAWQRAVEGVEQEYRVGGEVRVRRRYDGSAAPAAAGLEPEEIRPRPGFTRKRLLGTSGSRWSARSGRRSPQSRKWTSTRRSWRSTASWARSPCAGRREAGERLDEEPGGRLGPARLRSDRRLAAAGRARRRGDPPVIPCAIRAGRAVRGATPAPGPDPGRRLPREACPEPDPGRHSARRPPGRPPGTTSDRLHRPMVCAASATGKCRQFGHGWRKRALAWSLLFSLSILPTDVGHRERGAA